MAAVNFLKRDSNQRVTVGCGLGWLLVCPLVRHVTPKGPVSGKIWAFAPHFSRSKDVWYLLAYQYVIQMSWLLVFRDAYVVVYSV